MSDLNNTLTVGGFIATIVAVLLAIFAYFISRRSQVNAQKNQPAAVVPPETFTESSAESRPFQAFDPETNPYRWD